MFWTEFFRPIQYADSVNKGVTYFRKTNKAHYLLCKYTRNARKHEKSRCRIWKNYEEMRIYVALITQIVLSPQISCRPAGNMAA
jgi:hypothetical protein